MNQPSRTRPRLTMQDGRMLSTRAGLPHPAPAPGPRLPTLCSACHQEMAKGVAAIKDVEAGFTQVVIYCPHEAALCICTVSEGQPLGYELIGPVTMEGAEAALAARAGAAGPS